MNKALLFWSAILFLFAGSMVILFATGVIGPQRASATLGSPADDSHEPDDADGIAYRLSDEPVSPFELTDQRGVKYDTSVLAGKIWVASVFFASCTSVCRTQNNQVSKLQARYGDRGVEFVSITCDPDRDTPPALAKYSQLFGADPEKWHFLTGDFQKIRKVGNEMFHIMVDREVHSDRLILIGRDGKIIGTYRSTQLDEFSDLVGEIDELLTGESVEPETDVEPSAADGDEPDTQAEA